MKGFMTIKVSFAVRNSATARRILLPQTGILTSLPLLYLSAGQSRPARPADSAANGTDEVKNNLKNLEEKPCAPPNIVGDDVRSLKLNPGSQSLVTSTPTNHSPADHSSAIFRMGKGMIGRGIGDTAQT